MGFGQKDLQWSMRLVKLHGLDAKYLLSSIMQVNMACEGSRPLFPSMKHIYSISRREKAPKTNPSNLKSHDTSAGH